MSSVKERITKKAHSDPRVTIDTIHTELIKDMDHTDKSEYYLDNGLLLNDYYSGSMNTSNCTKGVLGYFNNEKKNVFFNDHSGKIWFGLSRPRLYLQILYKFDTEMIIFQQHKFD